MWTPVYFVRLVPLPASVHGVTLPNDDGTFDIYINETLSEAMRKDRLQHEIKHICEDHFYQEAKAITQLEQEANGAPVTVKAPDPVSATPPRLPNVFAEAPPGTIPYFSSLEAFRDYMFSMRDQVQRDKKQRQSAG